MDAEYRRPCPQPRNAASSKVWAHCHAHAHKLRQPGSKTAKPGTSKPCKCEASKPGTRPAWHKRAPGCCQGMSVCLAMWAPASGHAAERLTERTSSACSAAEDHHRITRTSLQHWLRQQHSVGRISAFTLRHPASCARQWVTAAAAAAGPLASRHAHARARAHASTHASARCARKPISRAASCVHGGG